MTTDRNRQNSRTLKRQESFKELEDANFILACRSFKKGRANFAILENMIPNRYLIDNTFSQEMDISGTSFYSDMTDDHKASLDEESCDQQS